MIQHPLPQNVTSYQFRLIGDMTIKQFVLLSLGVGGSIFFFYTNLFSPIKALLVIGSGALGFALAFIPFEDRPLDQWIANYIRAIYRPTRFIWRKNPPVPKFFAFESSHPHLPSDSQELARSAALRRQQGLRSFLVTLPQDQNDVMNSQESSSLSQILGLFNQSATPTGPVVTSLNIVPPIGMPMPDAASANLPPSDPSQKKASLSQTTGVTNLSPIKINRVESQNIVPDAAAQMVGGQPTSATIMGKNTDISTTPAATSTHLSFPSVPTTPNTVVGMVLDPMGKIVENAIIEVADSSGLTARATKTNQLGHFFSTTPLKSGVYRISAEKLGLNFDTIELNLSGGIVDPIKIQAK